MRSLLLFWLFIQDGFSQAEFEKLHKDLQPPKDEVWRTIPWKTSILEARDLSIREKKPVFMWAMVGHPLACV